MFCEVERSYIEDGFNLYGLRACVSNFSDCLDLILDRIGPDDSDDSHLTQSACTLYGLIHARYIITAHGLDAMYNKVSLLLLLLAFFVLVNSSRRVDRKGFLIHTCFHSFFFPIQYAAKEFGTCPLVQCAGQPVLPVGLKDEMGADTVKIFCPKCSSVYHPPPIRSRSSHHGGAGAAGVDGAAFGTTFPHLFLMTFSNLVPDRLPSDSAYVPRVFGFRVHMSARQRTTGSSSSSSGLMASSRPNGNRRNFTRRSGEGTSKDRSRNETAPQESLANVASAAQDASNDISQRGAKSSKQEVKEDEGNKKSKSSKRRADGETASSKKSDGNDNLESSSKRQKKK